MGNTILTYVELNRERQILPISLEAITAAKKIADKYEAVVVALVIGSDIKEAAADLSRYGVDKVFMVDDPFLATYQSESFVYAIEKVFEQLKPQAIIMGDTMTAIDLAPRLAFAFEAGLITDCTGIEIKDEQVIVTKPVFSNNVMATYSFPETPFLVTMRVRACEAGVAADTAQAEIIAVDISFDKSILKVEQIKIVTHEEEGPQLDSADIVVSGGRGLGGPEGFEELAELAGLLGGALGSSRPPCDLGWVSAKTQVGVTGTFVAPSLYIAVGISGSTQHVAGMEDSQIIVAINERDDANIFKIADLGIVGDYTEVIPALKEKLKEIL